MKPPQNKLDQCISADLIIHISQKERDWLETVFRRLNGYYPSLEQIWMLMDEAWHKLNCDPTVMDERIDMFYSHPVWLLNGLFIEQHNQSLNNRRCFTSWVSQQTPSRVADYGGGFGGLARMIGDVCQDSTVEIIEPHPHPAAIALAARTNNVSYQNELIGKYDILIATDVFEHVPDPLSLVVETAVHLHRGGHYLIANSFQPVILCHLPQNFHFHYSWEYALKAMGLVPGELVNYGRVYTRYAEMKLSNARRIEIRSKRLYPWIEHMPRRVRIRLGRLIAGLFCSMAYAQRT